MTISDSSTPGRTSEKMTMRLSDFLFPVEVFKLMWSYVDSPDLVFNCQECKTHCIRPRLDYSNCHFCFSADCDDCVSLCGCGCKRWCCSLHREPCDYCGKWVSWTWSCFVSCSNCESQLSVGQCCLEKQKLWFCLKCQSH